MLIRFVTNNRGAGREFENLFMGWTGGSVKWKHIVEANKKAADYAKELGLVTVGSSDLPL